MPRPSPAQLRYLSRSHRFCLATRHFRRDVRVDLISLCMHEQLFFMAGAAC